MLTGFFLLYFQLRNAVIIVNFRDATDTSSKGNNVRWVETTDGDGEFDELSLMEEGEPRYGLVQVCEDIYMHTSLLLLTSSN